MAREYFPDLPADDRSRLCLADKYFPDATADHSGAAAERGSHFRPLEPSVAPEPAMPESWRRYEERRLDRTHSGGRMFLRSFIVILLAAVGSFAIVLLLPAGQRFVGAQKATKEAVAKPDDRGPMRASRPTAGAGKAAPASATDRSQVPPAPMERKAVPAVRLATTPLVAPPVTPTPRASTTPASADRTPASSTAGKPVRAPANLGQQLASIDSAATSSVAPVARVKTVTIRQKKPVRPLNPDEAELLLKQGTSFVSVGDFASARVVFGRIAEARDARGALALAATYDPVALRKIGAKGAVPDIAKARQWYTKASELGSPDARLRLAALEESTGSANTGGSAAWENSASSEAAGVTVSYWKNDASIMRLEATGVRRKFRFLKPSAAETKAGAKVGSLRFDGKISGKGYTGTAFSYSEECGRVEFPVSGRIENDGGRVILAGKSPQMNRSCREAGKTHETLVFDFVKPGAK